MHGTFVWTELATGDVQKAMAFYADTLGWTFEPYELLDGDYWVIRSGNAVVGGIGGLDTAADVGASASAWAAFIEVDNLDKRVEKAKGLGATVLQPPHDVPNVGRVAVLRDPTGALIGWMTRLP